MQLIISEPQRKDIHLPVVFPQNFPCTHLKSKQTLWRRKREREGIREAYTIQIITSAHKVHTLMQHATYSPPIPLYLVLTIYFAMQHLYVWIYVIWCVKQTLPIQFYKSTWCLQSSYKNTCKESFCNFMIQFNKLKMNYFLPVFYMIMIKHV